MEGLIHGLSLLFSRTNFNRKCLLNKNTRYWTRALEAELTSVISIKDGRKKEFSSSTLQAAYADGDLARNWIFLTNGGGETDKTSQKNRAWSDLPRGENRFAYLNKWGVLHKTWSICALSLVEKLNRLTVPSNELINSIYQYHPQSLTSHWNCHRLRGNDMHGSHGHGLQCLPAGR